MHSDDPVGLPASVNNPRLCCFSHSVLNGCHFLISAWAYKSTLHVNMSRHVIIGTRPSPSLFLHDCETKAGVGRTGNEATQTLSPTTKYTGLIRSGLRD